MCSSPSGKASTSQMPGRTASFPASALARGSLAEPEKIFGPMTYLPSRYSSSGSVLYPNNFKVDLVPLRCSLSTAQCYSKGASPRLGLLFVALVLALQCLRDLTGAGKLGVQRQVPEAPDKGRWGAVLFGARDQFLLPCWVICVA